MKITTTIEKEVEVKFLQVSAGVRYWEDSTVNGEEDEQGDLMPCRDGDRWCPRIDIETGQIVNWTKGTTAEVHYKICDDGNYIVQDSDGDFVKKVDGYVPEIMCPKENGFGDYIIMDIDENGFIQDWNPALVDSIDND